MIPLPLAEAKTRERERRQLEVGGSMSSLTLRVSIEFKSSHRQAPMLVIPVIDILNGVVVRGIGGRRDEYRPLPTGSDPLTVATKLRQLCGHATLYLADLDAIVHRRPHHELYRTLTATGGMLLVDAGLRHVADAVAVAETGIDVIAGLETVPDVAMLQAIVAAVSSERMVFSLDLKQGRSLGGPGWPADVFAIIDQVVAAGIIRLIVLDLADVGSDAGGSTRALCRQIRDRWPELRLIAGGGVRGIDDLRQWSQLSLEGVLVASALHDGRITAGDIATLQHR
jgi:phosphoribosylformimino-5-aminoimidazole carboxamide ribotide isomerase